MEELKNSEIIITVRCSVANFQCIISLTYTERSWSRGMGQFGRLSRATVGLNPPRVTADVRVESRNAVCGTGEGEGH